MKIMLTGSNGFLGRNLQENLLTNYTMKSLVVRGDNMDTVEDKILDFKPDVFIHNGWSGGNNFNSVNSFEQFDNLNVGFNLLKVLSKLKDLHFIGLGSFSEYGVTLEISSEKSLENPNNYYGASKNMFKIFSKTFCQVNNFNWSWIRPCYVYGEHDVLTRLIPRVINSCLRKENLSLDSCSSVVDYLYVKDFVDAVEQIINSKSSGIINICSGNQYEVKEVIKLIKKVFRI